MHLPMGLEWVVILLVVVLLFGAKKIPDLAKGLGEGLREFKKAQHASDEDEKKKTVVVEPKPGEPPQSV